MTQKVMGSPRKIFLIATEPSGDHLGAALMKELHHRLGNEVVFAGIGGREMEEQGIVSLFPIDDLAIVEDPPREADRRLSRPEVFVTELRVVVLTDEAENLVAELGGALRIRAHRDPR